MLQQFMFGWPLQPMEILTVLLQFHQQEQLIKQSLLQVL